MAPEGTAEEERKEGMAVKATRSKLVKLVDQIERAMVVAFMVQFRGKVTLQDLKKDLAEKLGVQMHPSTLKATCEALKKGQFITMELIQTERGDSQMAASMRTTVFPRDIEVAQLPGSNFLPRLLATEGAEKIKGWFEKEEKAGKVKASNTLRYKHVHNFTIEAILLEDIIGSQIPGQRSDEIRRKFPEKNIEQTFVIGKKKGKGKGKGKGNDEEIIIEVSGLFARCPITGAYLLTTDVLRGWWKSNAMRYADLPEGTGEHAAFATTYIDPEQGVTQNVLPVQSQHRAAQPKAYECISAGEKITISFTHPTTGLLHPAQIEKLVLLASLRPKRGLSPARGIRYGRFLITKFTDHGPINGMPHDHAGPPPQMANGNGKGSLDFLLNGLPPKLLKDHGAYLKDAISRLSTVALGDGVSKNSPRTPFPAP